VHPNIAEHYRTKVICLAETLAEPESNGEAWEDIRSLIGEVVITPGDKRGESHAILRGELVAIINLAAGRRASPKPEVITNALAGPRNHRYRHSRSESYGSFAFLSLSNGLCFDPAEDHCSPWERTRSIPTRG
jgi:site-specific DNA recombinase